MRTINMNQAIEFLRHLSEQLRTQDNLCTSRPTRPCWKSASPHSAPAPMRRRKPGDARRSTRYRTTSSARTEAERRHKGAERLAAKLPLDGRVRAQRRRKAMTATLPMELPKCHKHGVQMGLRPLACQTPEQKFCGVWYDCPACTQSVLVESHELRAQLAEMRNREQAQEERSRSCERKLSNLDR